MQYRVIVYANKNALDGRKCLFERFVEYPENVVFPYTQILNSLKILFGSGVIVVFEVL